MNKKPFTPKQFEEIYSKVPRISVDLIIPIHGSFLLTLRTLPSWHNQWHLPGGTIYYRETVEQTAKRIAQEELGIQVEIKNLLGYIEYFSEEKERGFGYSIALALLCQAKSTEVQINDEAERIEFFRDLPSNMIPEQKRFMEKHWEALTENIA